MKKLITIALILCTLAITVVNCFASETIVLPDGKEARKNELYTEGFEKAEYSLCDDGLYDFCGIKAVAVKERFFKDIDAYYYIITTQDGADVPALCETLETTGLFEVVSPRYVYRDVDDIYVPEKGDINMNGELDARDYVLAKRAYFGTAAISDEARELADVNQNGELDARDYVLIKRVYFGTATFGEANATDDEISA